MSGRFELVRVLRSMNVPDQHIRATLQSELGLTDDEVDAAMRAVTQPAESDPAGREPET